MVEQYTASEMVLLCIHVHFELDGGVTEVTYTVHVDVHPTRQVLLNLLQFLGFTLDGSQFTSCIGLFMLPVYI